MQVPIQIDEFHNEIVRRIAKHNGYKAKRVRSMVVRNALERFDVLLTPEIDEAIKLVDEIKELCELIDQSPMRIIITALKTHRDLFAATKMSEVGSYDSVSSS